MSGVCSTVLGKEPSKQNVFFTNGIRREGRLVDIVYRTWWFLHVTVRTFSMVLVLEKRGDSNVPYVGKGLRSGNNSSRTRPSNRFCTLARLHNGWKFKVNEHDLLIVLLHFQVGYRVFS